MRVTVQIAPCLKSKLRFHVILSDLYTDIDKTGRGGVESYHTSGVLSMFQNRGKDQYKRNEADCGITAYCSRRIGRLCVKVRREWPRLRSDRQTVMNSVRGRLV